MGRFLPRTGLRPAHGWSSRRPSAETSEQLGLPPGEQVDHSWDARGPSPGQKATRVIHLYQRVAENANGVLLRHRLPVMADDEHEWVSVAHEWPISLPRESGPRSRDVYQSFR